MQWEAWFTLAVVGLVLGTLTLTTLSADVVFMGGMTLLVVAGVMPVSDAIAGFANEGVATVAILYVIVAGLRETGAISWIGSTLLGRPRSVIHAQVRLMLPVSVLSAVMNNTPLVAMMIPAVMDWSKRFRLAPSKLMIPLSFATVLGGLCTLIGTSTNLIVNGLVIKELSANPIGLAGAQGGLGFFSPAWVGLPCAIVGLTYLVIAGRWLLPERQTNIQRLANPREYIAEMIVEPLSPLIGKTIEQAGLRHLPGLFLIEINRDDEIISAVRPEETLHAEDRLVFAGIVESVVDLQKVRGLKPATDQVFKLDAPRSARCLVEAVVSDSHPVIGRNIRDGRFRNNYDAVVIAVARRGERINQKIGDIVLQAGDTLLLETDPEFSNRNRNSQDFFLVSQIGDSTPPRHERAGLALLILFAMVTSVTAGWIDILPAALLAAALMLATRCCTPRAARQSVDIGLLAAIASSFALSKALEQTGAAKIISSSLLAGVGEHPWVSLAAIYLITLLVTEVLSNNAAAVLMFPIAMATARDLGISGLPFVYAVMMAASAAFATPIGYQTHLMVYGPGGYRFSDYLKIGIPLDLLIALVAILLIPFIWSF